jgi:DNA-binding response OmpR family regulator
MVLVIEDEFFLQADLEAALTDAGYGVEIVSSGEEALTLFMGNSNTYRALVTDVKIAGRLDGWQVARQVREREATLPIIYVTGQSTEDWACHGVPKSVHISKPFARAQLVTALSNLLNTGPPSMG